MLARSIVRGSLATIRARQLGIPLQQRRFLDLQEYQSKQLLHENGITVQRFKVAENEEQISQVLEPHEFGKFANSRWSGHEDDISNVDEFVIKAQVLAGGRGKGYFKQSGLVGGVQLTKDITEASIYANQMLNDRLVTKQTGEEGVLVKKVMIAEAVRLKKEFYFALVLDASFDGGLLMVASPLGGMDIEEVAAKSETGIRKYTIPIDMDLDMDTARKMAVTAYDLGLRDADIIDDVAAQMIELHRLFLKLDATQIEINPLGVTNKRQVICVDAKIKFDENARFRHKWLDELELMNKSETDQRDFEARKSNLNFIGLDGSIGCLVNGAGLAMATMDIIKLHGGSPANFLDVGGGATAEQVAAAFKIIKSDPKVKAIFVNIFGGIMRCDLVAKGIIDATKLLDLNLPIVVRFDGTKVEEAKEMIKQSEPNIITCDDLDLAAQTAIKLASH